MTWRDEAACRGVNPAVFFPEHGNSNHQAKQLCTECPVQRDCLDEALERNELYGVWGGMSPDERFVLSGRRPTAGPAILNTLSDGGWWYTRDIAATAGLDRNTVQKALRRMHLEGLLEFRNVGTRVYQWRWPAAAERVQASA